MLKSLKLNKFQDIIIIPDGPLNSIPLHALPIKEYKKCIDCRSLDFNTKNNYFTYFPSVETFASLEEKDKPQNNRIDVGKIISEKTNTKKLKKIKEKILNNKKNKKSSTSSNYFYLGISK